MTNSNTPTAVNYPVQLAHYQLLASIGHGGMGLVYRARDTRLERDVAIKCLRRELFETHYIERFKREALLLAKLNHPNIVQIYDFVETPDQLALVMELVEGENLQIHLREHLASMSQRLKWLVQISEGLAVAHDAGIIHRDLKNENILINKHGQAKITDLGIAKSQDLNATLTDHIAGSYCSMSPEQAKGESINFKSDLFSLGILAYQLLCGAHPFGDTRNKLQLMQRIITETPTNPHQHNPDLPAEAIDLLGQLLSKDPRNRPDNTHWVAAQFERLKTIVKESSVNDDTQILTIPITTSASSSQTRDHPTFETHFTNAGKNADGFQKSSIRNFPGNNKILFSVGLLSVIMVTCIAIWQIQPLESTDEISATHSEEPYSQSREFNRGLEALTLYDQPGSLEKAEKNFNTILSHSPNNAAAVAGLSLVYSHRYNGDDEDPIWIQKADASAQQALNLNSQLALVHVALGQVFTIKAEHDKAFVSFDQALALEPTNVFAWRGKVTALRSAHRYDEAIQLAKQGLKQFPQERSIADELGNVYIDQDNYSKAEDAFRLSIQIQPDAVSAYANLYIALERQNRSDEAMQILQQGLQIRSSYGLHTNLGNALFVRGDYVGAAASFEAAVSPTKGNPGNYLGWANLADTLRWIPGREVEAKKAYRKARDLLTPLLQRRASDTTLMSRMALYAARVGDYPQAKSLLERAITLSPKSANVQFRAGLTYEILGEREAAIEAILKALDLGFPLKLIEAEPDLLDLRRTSGAF
jgi:eukaryotic-like serine/threonine-protein kinase